MSITKLPVELLTRVCEYLEPQDRTALRVTCHHIHNLTLETFTTNFKKISVLLTREGLECLEGIAASENLRGSVQEICVVPNLFDGWPLLDRAAFTNSELMNMPIDIQLNITPEKLNVFNAELETRFAVYEAALADHRAILDSSALFDTLEKCLPRLENVVDVGIRSHPIPFLLHESEHTSFRCLGLRALRDLLSPADKYKHWPMVQFRLEMLSMPHGLAFSQLLNAIIQSKRKVKSLHTCRVHCCGLNLGSLRLPASHYESLLPLLKDLTTLHMCVRIRGQEGEEEEFDEDTFKRLLGILVTAAPTLKILTFAQWSSMEELSPTYFKGLSQKICFSRLEELHLHSIEVTVNTLEDFLRTATSTLRRLSLRLVSLVDATTSLDPGPMTDNRASWGPSLSTEAQAEIARLWKRVFEFWADHLNLKSVQLSILGYRGREILLKDDLYKERGQPDAKIPTSGLNLKDFSFDAERASVSFKEWITQLRVEMQHPPVLGLIRLPGTSGIHYQPPLQTMSRQVTFACRPMGGR